MEPIERKENNLYYFTLFKLEGNKRWRAFIFMHKTGFEEEAKKGKYPNVTDKKIYMIDRLTGDFTLLEE